MQLSRACSLPLRLRVGAFSVSCRTHSTSAPQNPAAAANNKSNQSANNNNNNNNAKNNAHDSKAKATESKSSSIVFNNRDALPWRLIGSTILERHPLLLAEFPQWEKDYFEMKKRHRLVNMKPFLKWMPESWYSEEHDWVKKSKIPGDPDLPRITPDDVANNRKSLYRALESRLFLIVKKPGAKEGWQFPQGVFEEEDGDIRETAMRELEAECGLLLNTHYISNAPLACYTSKLSADSSLGKQFAGNKTFFFYSMYITGRVDLGPNVEDYAWVTKKELKEYFKSPELLAILDKILD